MYTIIAMLWDLGCLIISSIMYTIIMYIYYMMYIIIVYVCAMHDIPHGVDVCYTCKAWLSH